MIKVKNAFRFISVRLAIFSLNNTYTNMYSESNVANVYRSTLAYIRLGYSENESIVKTLVEMHIMTIEEVKIISTYDSKPKCSNPQGHDFSNITGKCSYCKILGCKYGLYNHEFSNITEKCSFCKVLGCALGLYDHEFSNITGKCSYLKLWDVSQV